MQHIFEKITGEFIAREQLLQQGDRILAGLSGGADSVCLLRVLCALREEMGLTLLAVHVHHGIRGESARQDAAFARKLCRQLKVPFQLVRADIPALSAAEGCSVEEAGRKFRYETFESIRAEEGFDKIAVAHHADDNAETVLLNLCRGTGLSGLCGMAPESGRIIRPLLCVRRAEIEAYLNEIGQPWRTDETNADPAYRRNRIRHRVIPELEAVNPRSAEHINQAARILRESEAYIARQTQEAVRACMKIFPEEGDIHVRNGISGDDGSRADSTAGNAGTPDAGDTGTTDAGSPAAGNAGIPETVPGKININPECCQVADINSGYHKSVDINRGHQCIVDINMKAFQSLDPLIQERVMLRAMETVCGCRKDLGQVHVRSLMELAHLQSGRQIDLPYGMRAQRIYDKIRIERQCRKKAADAAGAEAVIDPQELRENCTVRISGAGYTLELCVFSVSDDAQAVESCSGNPRTDSRVNEADYGQRDFAALIRENPYTKFVDCDKIKSRLSLRCCRSDDVIALDEAGHHKVMRRFLIDEKIPQPDRAHTAVVADGEHIVWIPGGRIGYEYRLSSETERILKMKILS